MIIKNYVKFSQEQIDMFMFKVNIEDILSGSEILRYDAASGENYQRAPIPAHYRKIAKYLMNSAKPIMPTAILGAIDEKDLIENGDELVFSSKIRIVDGQHRLCGVECLKDGRYIANSEKRFEELKSSFEFPVILMVLKEEDKLVEVDAFININSAGKSVKTDLAEALKRQKYFKKRTGDSSYTVDDALLNTEANKLATRFAQEDSFWKDCILLPNMTGAKPISVLAFMRAIRPIVVLAFKGRDEVTPEELRTIEDSIFTDFNSMWNVVINRWSECFGNERRSYDDRFNICKGIGVFPLCQIYADCIKQDKGIMEFTEIINDSNVKYTDWYVGGNFTGYASQQGFNQIRKFIIGEISRDDFEEN